MESGPYVPRGYVTGGRGARSSGGPYVVRQTNNFAAVVLKPDLSQDLHPWLRQEGNGFALNDEWVTARYGPSR